MAITVRFNNTDDDVLEYNESGNQPDYIKYLPHVVFNPDLTAVAGTPRKYWKLVLGAVEAMTAQERTNKDTAIAVAALTALRAEAVALIDSGEGIDRRALADMVVSELNNIRQWLAAFKVEVAASSSLADLKARVASLPNMPDRTLSQARTAYKNSISNGNVDS